MKYLSSIILSLVLLGIWGCSDLGVSCSDGLDCAGECGGDAKEDCAGTCNGDANIVDDICTNISYSETIQPIFTANCTSCHGGNGSLFLDTYAHVMNGGESGEVIISGNSATSYLWQRVNNGEMSPGANPGLSSTDVSLIAQWINEGAIEN